MKMKFYLFAFMVFLFVIWATPQTTYAVETATADFYAAGVPQSYQGESQVTFGTKYFNGKPMEYSSLWIQGYNQNDAYTYWPSRTGPATFPFKSSTTSINNWWWKPYRGIRFEFSLRWWTGSSWSQGTRWCTIYRFGLPEPNWIDVRYSKDYTCTYTTR